MFAVLTDVGCGPRNCRAVLQQVAAVVVGDTVSRLLFWRNVLDHEDERQLAQSAAVGERVREDARRAVFVEHVGHVHRWRE